MLFVFIFLFFVRYALSCMSTVPGDGNAPCQQCGPLYDPTLCEGISGCSAAPEADVVAYTYGACTSAKFKYPADSQMKWKGFEPFSKANSSLAATYGTATCTSDSKWLFNYVYGTQIIESLIFYTTDCVLCTTNTIQTIIGDMADTAICNNEVMCLPNTPKPTFTASDQYCSLATMTCPAGADVLVADVKGQFTKIPLTSLTDGTARLICKAGQMAVDSDGTVAMGDFTKLTCAMKNGCGDCDETLYFNHLCAIGGLSKLTTVDGTYNGICKQWTFNPIVETNLVWTYQLEGEPIKTFTGQDVVTAAAGGLMKCVDGEMRLTIASQGITDKKMVLGVMQVCPP